MYNFMFHVKEAEFEMIIQNNMEKFWQFIEYNQLE